MTSIITFYLLTIPISYKLSEYLAIGRHIWFGEFIYNVTSKLDEKGYDRLSRFITNLSYFKLITCRPCLSFWSSWAINSAMCNCNWKIAFVLSLLTYFITKKYDSDDEEIQ